MSREDTDKWQRDTTTCPVRTGENLNIKHPMSASCKETEEHNTKLLGCKSHCGRKFW